MKERHQAVARVYSDALLEVAEAQDAVEPLGEELDELSAQIERDPLFRAFLESPLVDADKRRGAIERMFRGRFSDLLVDGLQVMNRKRRIGLLPEVARAYQTTLNERLGRVEVEVITAVPLDDAQRRHIEEAVAQGLGQKAVLRESVEPGLIGGIVFQIGDRKIDGSVASHLDTLSKALLTRASRENAEAYVER